MEETKNEHDSVSSDNNNEPIPNHVESPSSEVKVENQVIKSDEEEDLEEEEEIPKLLPTIKAFFGSCSFLFCQNICYYEKYCIDLYI